MEKSVTHSTFAVAPAYENPDESSVGVTVTAHRAALREDRIRSGMVVLTKCAPTWLLVDLTNFFMDES